VRRRKRGAGSIDIVHAVDRRPVFIDPEGAGRKAGGLARIGPVPFAEEVFDGVRGVLQRIVFFVHAPLRDCPRLLANGGHPVAETVESPLLLRLGGSAIGVPRRASSWSAGGSRNAEKFFPAESHCAANSPSGSVRPRNPNRFAADDPAHRGIMCRSFARGSSVSSPGTEAGVFVVAGTAAFV